MDQGKTRVLLTIVSNPHSHILPHSLFYRFFSQYGEVYKILIFEKGKLWKCFIEMATLQQAQIAQQHLNGHQLFENTMMNVYFSTLQTVTFVNNNSGGVDYRAMKQRSSTRTMTLTHSPSYPKVYSQPTIYAHPISMQNLEMMKASNGSFAHTRTRASSNGTQGHYEFGKLKAGDQEYRTIQTSLEFIGEPCEDDIFESENASPKKSSSMNQIWNFQDEENAIESPDEAYDPIDDDIMNAFSNEKNFRFAIPEVEDKKQEKGSDIDPYTYISPQFLRENQPSRVVYMRGLNPILTPLNIFNLLSNFGNVLVIIYIKHKTSALVQFEKLLHAQNALDHLNNQLFFGMKLKIFYSNYQEIQFPLPFQSAQTQVFIPQPGMHRFNDGKSISFNPPSQTLHLSNIKNKLCEDEQAIRELFRNIGTVQAVKFIHIEKYKNQNMVARQKHMALVRLSSCEEALNGAALLHGKEVMGRKINVSFTKSKLC